MDVLTFAVAIYLVAVFGNAFFGHALGIERFSEVLDRLGLRSPGAAARLLTSLDAVIVVTLLVTPEAGAWAAASYLIAATAVVAHRHLVRGETVSDCGCSHKRKAVTAGFFVRNAALIGGGIIVALNAEQALLTRSTVVWLLPALAAVAALRVVMIRRSIAVPTAEAFDEESTATGARSRREVLALGLRGAGLGAVGSLVGSAAAFASDGIFESDVSGVGRKINKDTLIEEGPSSRPVQRLIARSDEFAAALAMVPGAARIDWDSAQVWSGLTSSPDYRLPTLSVYAPLVDAAGNVVGNFTRFTGQVMPKTRRGALVELETRAQFGYNEGDRRLVVLQGRDGALETKEVPLPPARAADASASPALEDCDTELALVVDAACRTSRCQSCDFFTAEPCSPGAPLTDLAKCTIVKCRYCYYCCTKVCWNTCIICSGDCCGECTNCPCAGGGE